MLVIKWELSGPQSGQWWMDVTGGKHRMRKRKISDPNVTFVARDKDWVARHRGVYDRATKNTRRLGARDKLGEISP
jgi:hypothetical protein